MPGVGTMVPVMLLLLLLLLLPEEVEELLLPEELGGDMVIAGKGSESEVDIQEQRGSCEMGTEASSPRVRAHMTCCGGQQAARGSQIAARREAHGRAGGASNWRSWRKHRVGWSLGVRPGGRVVSGWFGAGSQGGARDAHVATPHQRRSAQPERAVAPRRSTPGPEVDYLRRWNQAEETQLARHNARRPRTRAPRAEPNHLTPAMPPALTPATPGTPGTPGE